MGDGGDITIRYNATGNAEGATKRLTMNIRELGEKVALVGSRMTMFLTVPIVGAGMAINKYGQDASKQLAELEKNLDAALASGNAEKIEEANRALAAMPREVKDAARAYGELQRAMEPVNRELQRAKSEALGALVPILKDLAPTLKNIAAGVASVVRWFGDLPTGVQKSIVGFVGFLALAGPLMMFAGQIINMFGTAKMIIESLGVSATLTSAGGLTKMTGTLTTLAKTVGPILALVEALKLLKRVWEEYGGEAMTSARQLFAIAMRPVTNGQQWLAGTQKLGLQGRAGGGPVLPGRSYLVGERGPEYLRMGASGGYVTPSGGGAGGGGVNVIVNYNPAVSLGNAMEAQAVLAPMIERALRQRGAR